MLAEQHLREQLEALTRLASERAVVDAVYEAAQYAAFTSAVK